MGNSLRGCRGRLKRRRQCSRSRHQATYSYLFMPSRHTWTWFYIAWVIWCEVLLCIPLTFMDSDKPHSYGEQIRSSSNLLVNGQVFLLYSDPEVSQRCFSTREKSFTEDDLALLQNCKWSIPELWIHGNFICIVDSEFWGQWFATSGICVSPNCLELLLFADHQIESVLEEGIYLGHWLSLHILSRCATNAQAWLMPSRMISWSCIYYRLTCMY